MALAGRSELWAELLHESTRPILGSGYQSFWLGPGGKHMWAKYSFHPNQAHNGYLETYLNGGLIGLCLLMAMIVSGGSKLKTELLFGGSYPSVCFAFLLSAVVYNWAEAAFNE